MNAQPQPNPKTGMFLIGTLKGVRHHQKNGSNYVNYFVGICIGEKKDDYGVTSELVEELSINDKQYAQILQQTQLIGQPVKAPFRVSLRKGTTDGGKPWSFLSQYLPQEYSIEPLNKVQPVADKKAN